MNRTQEYSVSLKIAFCKCKEGFLSGKEEPELQYPNFPVRTRARTWLRFLRSKWSEYSWTEKTKIPCVPTLHNWVTAFSEHDTKGDGKDSVRPVTPVRSKRFKQIDRKWSYSSESIQASSEKSGGLLIVIKQNQSYLFLRPLAKGFVMIPRRRSSYLRDNPPRDWRLLALRCHVDLLFQNQQM